MGKPTSRGREGVRFASTFATSAVALIFAAGCGAPGEPTPPSPPVPAAVTDLSAHQQGDGVEVVFTLPSRTIHGDRLAGPPAIEVLRGSPEPGGAPDPKSFRVVYTIPGALVSDYMADGQVKFAVAAESSELSAHAGNVWFYSVRTRLSQKRASADSNIVQVRLFPVPLHIATLTARLTEKAIELSWAAPANPSGADSDPAISGYHVYRGELDANSTSAAASDSSQAKWKSPLRLLASTEETKYEDTFFDFGRTYAYVVRSVVMADGKPLESSDSNSAIITPQDIFPPAPPQNLVANVVPGPAPDSLVVDLSWSISPETDLAGYRVYRSEEQGAGRVSVTPELLLAPAHRDTSVEPGHRYWYSVTAVDRAGNESAPSTAVAVDVAKP